MIRLITLHLLAEKGREPNWIGFDLIAIVRIVVTAMALWGFTCETLAQESTKRPLAPEDCSQWKIIGPLQISSQGRWLVYGLHPGQGSDELVVRELDTNVEYRFPAGREAKVTYGETHVLFFIDHSRNKRNQPSDLGILDLSTGQVDTVKKVQTFELPTKGGAFVAYLQEHTQQDDIIHEGHQRSVSSDNRRGLRESTSQTLLVWRDLETGVADSMWHVTEFIFTPSTNWLFYAVEYPGGQDNRIDAVHCSTGDSRTLLSGGKDYRHIVVDETERQVVFMNDRDTTETEHSSYYTAPGSYRHSCGHAPYVLRGIPYSACL